MITLPNQDGLKKGIHRTTCLIISSCNMNIKKYFAAAALLLGTATDSFAVSAYPGIIKVAQADGTEISIRILGDERANFTTTADGYPIILNYVTGNYEYAVANGGKLAPSGIVAADAGKRSAKADALLSAIDKEALAKLAVSERRSSVTAPANLRKGPKRILTNNFPHFGEQHSIIILMEFNDKEFSVVGDDPKQFYTDCMNEEGFTYKNGATGSARDFFIASSQGLFKPTFDVYGPVKINYGQHDAGQGTYNTSINMGTFVKAAVQGLDSEVDFSQYDHDGDGYVDNVYIIYAGLGSADSRDSRVIWPHAFDMREWGINVTTNDGVKIGSYTCSNEVDGQRTSMPDGIGTFVHEFGHCLGFADHYNTENSYDTYHPGEWDTMAAGSYNNNSNTPPLYSSYECYELGWLKPEPLTGQTEGIETLPNLGDSHKAYKIDVPGKENEYFLLENRQKTGWDKYLPHHGMLIWHIDIDQTAWDENEVNNVSSHQRVDIVEANGRPSGSEYYQTGVPFPGANNVTEYSFKAWDKTDLLSIENITEADSTITFNVLGANSGITTPQLTVSDVTFDGFKLSWNKVDGADGYVLDIKKNDGGTLTDVNAYKDKVVTDTAITVSGLEESTDYEVSLMSKAGSFRSDAATQQVKTEAMPFASRQVKNLRATEINANSFRAEWDKIDEAQTYDVTLQKLSYTGDDVATEYDFAQRKEGMPTGWATNCNNFISSEGSYGKAAPAVRMTANGSYITMGNTVDGADAMVENISFWYNVTTASEGAELDIQALRSGEWLSVGSIDLSEASTGTKALQIEPAKQVRIYLKRTGTASVTVDDVAVSGKQIEATAIDRYADKNIGAENSCLFDALEAQTQYSLTVTAEKNGEKTKPSKAITLTTAAQTADGISTVNGEEAEGASSFYDLSGRRIKEGMTNSGVVIRKQNGKAVKTAK